MDSELGEDTEVLLAEGGVADPVPEAALDVNSTVDEWLDMVTHESGCGLAMDKGAHQPQAKLWLDAAARERELEAAMERNVRQLQEERRKEEAAFQLEVARRTATRAAELLRPLRNSKVPHSVEGPGPVTTFPVVGSRKRDHSIDGRSLRSGESISSDPYTNKAFLKRLEKGLKTYNGEGEPMDLAVWERDLISYLENASAMTDSQAVLYLNSYLEGRAKAWWQRKYDEGPLSTPEDVFQGLREEFIRSSQREAARRKMGQIL
ncbi:hypothetical protein HDU86_008320 [Geranomyces michiganensis]|nr:hypothetical protein HDU86_008320 [Geranomyces michiganensis]